MQSPSTKAKTQVQYVFKWKETPVFTGYGYSLYEDFSGGYYNYRVVNIRTGESKYICRKVNRVPKVDYAGLIPKPKPVVQQKSSGKRKSSIKHKSCKSRKVDAAAPQFVKSTGKLSAHGLCVDVKPNEKITREVYDKVLSRVFKEYLPKHGYNLRSGQIELALHIGDAICRRKISMSE